MFYKTIQTFCSDKTTVKYPKEQFLIVMDIDI